MYSGSLETLAWNFLISSLRVELYTFFSFWYWHWFANLSCLWSADSFAIFSFWYWHWFSNLYSLHSADSFAVFSFWYWRLTVSLLYILLIHLQFLVFDTEIGLPVSFFFIHKIHLHFSFSCSVATGPTSFPLIPHFHLPFFFSHIHYLCLVSFISKRQIFNFWTLLNILQTKFIISDKGTFNFKRNNPYL